MFQAFDGFNPEHSSLYHIFPHIAMLGGTGYLVVALVILTSACTVLGSAK
jgi:hypothetical protein